MIFLDFGIIVGVYAGTRWWQSRRHAAASRARPAQLPAPSEEAAAAARQLDEHRHHFKLSVMTTVSCSVGYWLYPPLSLLNVGLITYSAVPILDRAEESLRHDARIQNDGYSALIALLCLGGGQYFAGAMHNAIYHLGSRMVGESKEIAGAEVGKAFLHQADEVWVLRDGVEIELPLVQVETGDVLLVRTGEVVPIDGEIIQGRALIDQQVLTGEMHPAEKSVGDKVLASTLILAGRIQVRAACGGAETKAHKLEEMLHQTRDYKTQLQLKGEAWSDQAALPLLGVSAVVWPLAGAAPATALLFSAPTNTVRALLSLQTSTHLQWAASQGILIKDGRVLEELPWVDMVLFDKTGTLTQSRPQVARILTCAERDENTLLALAAAAEQHLFHPIAEALLDEAAARKLSLPEVRDSRYDLGLGVSAVIDGHRVQVGSRRFIKELCGEVPLELERAMSAAEGHTFVLVALGGRVQGALELYPRLRPEVPRVIEELRARGIRNLALVSGDADAPCQRLAQELELDAVYSEVMPHAKAELIRGLQSQGHRVCFIGDGLNDAIAMKQANVSICLASAAGLTNNVAQIVLVDDKLTHLRDAFDLGAHLHLRLGGNLGFWIGFGLVNAVCVPLLHFTPLQSSVLYAGAFAVGFQRARSPGWLERPGRHENPARGQVIEQTKALAS